MGTSFSQEKKNKRCWKTHVTGRTERCVAPNCCAECVWVFRSIRHKRTCTPFRLACWNVSGQQLFQIWISYGGDLIRAARVYSGSRFQFPWLLDVRVEMTRSFVWENDRFKLRISRFTFPKTKGRATFLSSLLLKLYFASFDRCRTFGVTDTGIRCLKMRSRLLSYSFVSDQWVGFVNFQECFNFEFWNLQPTDLKDRLSLLSGDAGDNWNESDSLIHFCHRSITILPWLLYIVMDSHHHLQIIYYGAVRIMSWYPKFNGSHFGLQLPPSYIHKNDWTGGQKWGEPWRLCALAQAPLISIQSWSFHV